MDTNDALYFLYKAKEEINDIREMFKYLKSDGNAVVLGCFRT